jgi:hypothetical protein
MKLLKKNMMLTAGVGLTVATLAPQVTMAHNTATNAHKHTTSTRALVRADERHLARDDARISNLEAEVNELRSQLSAQKTSGEQMESKQQQLETQVAAEAAKEEEKNNLVFFRGGFAQLAQKRGNELLVNSNLNGDNSSYNQDGWYVGAGMDFRASDDLFGLTDLVALDAELFFQYQNYGTATNGLVNSYASSVVGVPLTVENQVTMFTLAASPKFKFNLLEGNFRPWIAPVGLAIQVVSPPSSGVTVLNPALMLGTGLEYRIWKDIWLGTDFRYQFGGGDLQYSARTADGVSVLNSTTTNGLQAGGYIGIGF